MHNKILVIRVQRSRVRDGLPFDKLYLVPRDKQKQINKLFGFAFVSPVTNTLLDSLSKISPSRVFGTSYIEDLPNAATSKAWWKENIFDPYTIHDRVVVIPVLPKNTKNGSYPRYITGWKKSHYRRGKVELPLLSELTYLATPYAAPNDIFQPICTACPRVLQRLQGECSIGSQFCYNSLNFANLKVK